MSEKQLNVQDFTDAVKPLTDFLHKKFEEGLCVSDIRDVLGKQYVDLVQEGGGVHGIALGGYTYVLEKMNIGFMKMAGSSVGAINTLLLNAVYTEKEAELMRKDGYLKNSTKYYETRSEKALEYLTKKDLSELIDGHPLWQKFMLNISGTAGGGAIKKSFSFFKKLFKLLVVLLVVLLISAIVLIIYPVQNTFNSVIRTITGISVLGIIAITAFFVSKILFARLLYKHAFKMGINPGDNIEQWITEKLEENGIHSVTDLNTKFEKEKEILQHRYLTCQKEVAPLASVGTAERQTFLAGVIAKIKNPRIKIATAFDDLQDIFNSSPDISGEQRMNETSKVMRAFEERLGMDRIVTREIVIVSSDISHGMKVEFPGMHKLYWGNDYSISPAKYVRASMAMPVFFKPLKVNFLEKQLPFISDEWFNFAKIHKNLQEYALFVDGGLLSNFPINVFYNTDMPVPRKPTFGVKLGYSDESESAKIQNMMELTGSMINTMRYFYDREFALKHDMYLKTVRSVDTGKIHWINFSLTEKEKIELFFRGALAATIFLAKHAMTDDELKELLDLGKNVQLKDKTFSIYEDDKVEFKTQDSLMTNVTFEWHPYKEERLMDRISKKDRKKIMKAEASLKNL